MSMAPTSYYSSGIDLSNVDAVETQLKSLLDEHIDNVSDLKLWLKKELQLDMKIQEALAGHTIDFYRDTMNEGKKQIHMHDQTAIQPLLLQYGAKMNQKFNDCHYTQELDDEKYGLMRQIRKTELELFREENIPLKIREQELIARYNEIVGGLMVDWDGESKPYPFLMARLDDPHRTIREKAWRAIVEVRKSVHPEVSQMMTELVHLRHQIALNAGFANYRDYSFREKNREYTVEDCNKFYHGVEKQIIPVWDRLAKVFQKELGIDSYRPWDTAPCTISGAPFQDVNELMNGVERMLSETDEYFGNRFQHMRSNGLLDLESRSGKAPGGFCEFFGYSKNSFVFANFSPSFFALIALIHEMGHAVNGYLQIRDEPEWMYLRAEVAELYSHGMELLCLDKLGEFYHDDHELKNAQRELLHRSLNMLMGPLSGDMFQHWMYEFPDHTAQERDAKYREILKRFSAHPVDYTGFEEELGIGWIDTIHFIAYPFYNIEYSISELGALQLLETYRLNPDTAIENYKRGASTDYNQSIAEIYNKTGVSFDFSEESVRQTGQFLESVIESLS